MQLTHDSGTNTLRLALAIEDAPEHMATIDGILDIGAAGRLIGIEFPADSSQLHHWLTDDIAGDYTLIDAAGRAYIQISPDSDGDFRSTPLRLTAEYNAHGELIALVIPRRGAGYEISYPSGNQ